MKRLFLLLLVLSAVQIQAQSNLNEILAAGLADAERFSNDYLNPASEGAIHNISNGWYNSGESKPLGGFEISIIGNYSPFKNKEDKKTFVLNTEDYENIQFDDGSTSKTVSSALGDIEGLMVFVEGEPFPGTTVREDFELPAGLASEDINFIPSAFVQVAIGLVHGTEIKARFFPTINTEEASYGLYGFGLQHEFTHHLAPLVQKRFPVRLSAVIGYTRLDATYDFTNSGIIAGSDQKIDIDMSSWIFQAVASTKLPVINFYAGIGYMTGKSKTDVLGTYIVQSGPFQQTYEDPFTLNHQAKGVRANLGAKLKLGFFRLNFDYTIAEFNSLSAGINFGMR